MYLLWGYFWIASIAQLRRWGIGLVYAQWLGHLQWQHSSLLIADRLPDSGRYAFLAFLSYWFLVFQPFYWGNAAEIFPGSLSALCTWFTSTLLELLQPFYCRYAAEILPDFGQLMPYCQWFSSLLLAVILDALAFGFSASVQTELCRNFLEFRALVCSYGVVISKRQ